MAFTSKTPKAPKKPGQQMGPQPSTTAGAGGKKPGPIFTPPPVLKSRGFTGAPK